MAAIERRASREPRAAIAEIFSSIQGEGLYVGFRQVFVRFVRCNMSCRYCDEVNKLKTGSFVSRSVGEVLSEIDRIEAEDGPHHSVSLTGGEPLLYAAFLRSLLPRLKQKGKTVYLETNGTLPGALRGVIGFCDIIAMDLKPPSSTLNRPFYDEHKAFLKIASKKDVFVKVVITASTKIEEIRRCLEIVREVDANIPFVFQPVSYSSGVDPRSVRNLERGIFKEAIGVLGNVRVIPQLHKTLGMR